MLLPVVAIKMLHLLVSPPQDRQKEEGREKEMGGSRTCNRKQSLPPTFPADILSHLTGPHSLTSIVTISCKGIGEAERS